MDTQLVVFRPKPIFQVLYTAPLLLLVLALVDLLRRPSPESWVILAIVLWVAWMATPRGWARVTLDAEQLTLHMPLRKPRSLAVRQLIDVETSGRFGQALLLRYHPLDQAGRLDIASEEFLGLAPLDRQYLLEERLRAVVGNDG